jgi:spore maturation protein A
MKELQTLNTSKEVVSFEMMLFVVINTSSLQLIPFTIIGLLAQYGSKNPAWVVLPTIIATVVSTISALAILYLFSKFSSEPVSSDQPGTGGAI